MIEEEKKMEKVNKEIPMHILIWGSKIERLYIESLFKDDVKKNCINKFNYDEYIYSYGWKFDIFKEGLSKKHLSLVFQKIREDFQNEFWNDLILCFIEDSSENAKKWLNILFHKRCYIILLLYLLLQIKILQNKI